MTMTFVFIEKFFFTKFDDCRNLPRGCVYFEGDVKCTYGHEQPAQFRFLPLTRTPITQEHLRLTLRPKPYRHLLRSMRSVVANVRSGSAVMNIATARAGRIRRRISPNSTGIGLHRSTTH